MRLAKYVRQMRKIILIFFFLGFNIFLFYPQDQITEEVDVDWWILPIFALDSIDNPVIDLQSEDIKLSVNRKEIKNFTLIKKNFSSNLENKQDTPIIKKPIQQKKNMIFLIFDTAVSGSGTILNSKTIARKIVNNSNTDTWFTVMTIAPLSGLTYAGGPVNNKNVITNIISTKVNRTVHSKNFSIKKALKELNVSGGPRSKYTLDEIKDFLLPSAYHFFKQKSKNFFDSFKYLYYSLYSIKENKFIYLFSEGISKDAQVMELHGESEYRFKIKKVAEFLGRSGAVLFIIDCSMQTDSDFAVGSGIDFLKYFAKTSGGKLLRGDDKRIIKNLKNFNRAYYEIAFADLPTIKGITRHINIKSKRKGIKIHTLKTIEKKRDYYQMKDIEKEVMVLNLITGNQLARTFMKCYPVNLDKIVSSQDKKDYYLSLPDEFLNKNIDCFKVWINPLSGDTQVKKESINSTERDVKISFEKNNEDTKTYFVLVNGSNNAILMRGMMNKKSGQSSLTNKNLNYTTNSSIKNKIKKIIQKQDNFIKTAVKEKSLDQSILGKILNGSADYCRKLNQASIHFICQEKIAETISLQMGSNLKSANMYDYIDYLLWGSSPNYQSSIGPVKKNKISSVYLFDYQMIKNKNNITEQRKFLKGKNEKRGKAIAEYRIRSFLSQRVIFAPYTLLGKNRQNKYQYRLLGYKKRSGHTFAVIDTRPINPKDARYIYGKLWVDTKDFSIIKIQVNPDAIRGHEKLLEFAKKLQTKLFLECEIDFNKTHRGLRFPTQIVLTEKYKGGPVFRKEWNRCKTVYTYKDYKFFMVTAEEGE